MMTHAQCAKQKKGKVWTKGCDHQGVTGRCGGWGWGQVRIRRGRVLPEQAEQ
jgi:hypothetical protein